MIKIDFEINGFSDALYLEVNHGLSEVQIQAMKQARYDKWYAIINDPNPPQIEPVIEE
jgi:hypothetical protein